MTSDATRPSVMALSKIRSSHSPSLSPDGEAVAFICDLTGVPQVWTVAAQGGWPTLVTDTQEHVQAVRWSPDGRWIAVQAAPGGGMNSQLYVVRPDGTDARRLSLGSSDNNRLGRWVDAAHVLAMSNRDDPARFDAFALDVETGAFECLARGSAMVNATDVFGDRVVIVRTHYRGDGDVSVLDRSTGAELLLTPHDPPATFGGGRFGAHGDVIYLSSNADRDLTALARVRLDASGAGTLEIVVERDDAELDAFHVSDDRTNAVLVWNVGGRNELSLLDLTTGEQRPGPSLEGDVVMGLDTSDDGSRIAVAMNGSAVATDVWMFERDDPSSFARVTSSPHPGVDVSALVRPTLERFAAHDGLELTGWLYRSPVAAEPGPVVCSFHGGPEGQERPRLSPVYQALLAEGVGVFAPNIRGSSGFGKAFVHLDDGALRFDANRDIEACVDHVIAIGVADPERVGVMGGSYGGYVTMVALTDYPDRFAAGANLYGIVNFETFFEHTESWMAAISKTEYGDPSTQREMLRALSPIHKLDRVRAPTIVLHGANDTNVPVVEAEQVVAALRERGVPVEYVLFDDEGHGFSKTANRITSTAAIVEFFVRYLVPGHEDGLPSGGGER